MQSFCRMNTHISNLTIPVSPAAASSMHAYIHKNTYGSKINNFKGFPCVLQLPQTRLCSAGTCAPNCCHSQRVRHLEERQKTVLRVREAVQPEHRRSGSPWRPAAVIAEAVAPAVGVATRHAQPEAGQPAQNEVMGCCFFFSRSQCLPSKK